jgi:hypothetical protein
MIILNIENHINQLNNYFFIYKIRNKNNLLRFNIN